MAELEIHNEPGHVADAAGQKVGVLSALLAVGLALATIASHRAHTEGILLKAEANDKWQYYQSKRIKFHNLELGEDLLSAIGANNESAKKALATYAVEMKRYKEEGEKIQEEARQTESQAERAEHRALRYDFGEGLLEIGLVLSSLYFVSRKKLFPVIGVVAGIAGGVVAITGLLI